MHVLAMLEMHSAKELNGCHVHHVPHSQQQHQTRPHRQRPRSKELQYSHESLDGLDGAVQAQSQQRHPRYHHHHHHHHQQRQQQQQQQQRYNHVQEQEERDDTEDNLADEEFEDDEVGRDVRQKRLQKPDLNHKRADGDGKEEEEVDADDDDEDDDEDEEQDQDHRNGGHKEAAPLTNGSMRGLEANVINDELKYGAAHLNHQSMDSNPLESQSEWSDDDCREEATGEDRHRIPFPVKYVLIC